jgi:hypothetical protein
MYDLIKQEMPGWLKVARAVAGSNSYTEINRIPNGAARYDLARKLADLADSRLETEGNHSIAEAIVGYLVGPAFPMWECVALDADFRDGVIPLFSGWELCDARHPSMQVLFPRVRSGDTHRHYPENAVLRRQIELRDRPLASVPAGERELTWPMIILNLVRNTGIRAIRAYRLESGRGIIRTTDSFSTNYLPAEVYLWDQNANSEKHPGIGHSSLNEITDEGHYPLSAVAAALACRLFSLDTRRRDSFARAADRYMAVTYRSFEDQGIDRRYPRPGKMPSGEAVARLAAVIELLLTGEDSDKVDLTRKVSQRAAVLLGHDDDERLEIRDLAKIMYRVRSAHVHGGPDTSIELPQIRELARKVMTAWLILSPKLNRGKLPELLDNALLSRKLLAQNVTEPVEEFWADVEGAS